MKRAAFIACVVLAICLLGAGQSANSIPPEGTFSQINFPLLTSLPPVNQANVSITGNPGTATYYYWLVANYTFGQAAILHPFVLRNAPTVLSSSNYVSILPVYPVGANSVDLLRTSSPSPPSGTGNYAVSTGNTSGAINDQGGALSSYTVAPANPDANNICLSNQVISAGVSHLWLGQGPPNACVNVVDLNLGGGGGSGTVTNFSAGNLSPIFTTSVATSTTTPVLSFTLSNAPPNSVLANLTGSAGPPSYVTTQGTDAALLTSGTIGAGAGLTLCTDGNSGATTTGCSGGGGGVSGSGTGGTLAGWTGSGSSTTLGNGGCQYQLSGSNFAEFICSITAAALNPTMGLAGCTNTGCINPSWWITDGAGASAYVNSDYIYVSALGGTQPYLQGIELGIGLQGEYRLTGYNGSSQVILQKLFATGYWQQPTGNGSTIVLGQRFTDSAPTGNFLSFVNNAKNSTLFQVDALGDVLAAGTVTLSAITGSIQCLHVNSSGLISGTGADCGTGGGSGTVTSFSAGNLSPLFTTSVATSTTTPALTFSLSNAGAHTVLANLTGSSAAPSYTTTQGTDSAVLTSGTISGTGAALCTDANGGATTSGCTSGSAFQVNAVALTSSTTVNFENSAAFNGLTATFSNPSAGNVQLGFTGTLHLSGLSTQAANTIVGNGTGSVAAPTALAIPSCSTASSALTWTSATGFGCNTITGGAAFQVNGVALTSATTVNFENSGAFNGLTFTVSNPSAGNVQLGATGTLNLAGLSTQAANTLVGNATSGTASPTAISISACATALTWTSGSGFGCSSTVGTINAASQYAPTYYSASGMSTTLSGVSPPTTNGNWSLTWAVTSSAAVAPTFSLAGVGARAVTGTTATDTVLYSDDTWRIDYQGSVAVAVSLPTPTTLGNQTFAVRVSNDTTGSNTAVTVTPAGSFLIGGQSALIIPQGVSCVVTVDASGSFWNRDCSGLPATPWVSKTGSQTLADSNRAQSWLSADVANDTYTLPAPSSTTFLNGWYFWLKNGSTTNTIALTPSGATIDGSASITQPAHTAVLVVSDGTNYHTLVISPVGNNAQNLVFASPNGSSGLPSMRALVAADLGTPPGGTVLGNNTTSTGVASFITSVALGVPASSAGSLLLNSSTSSTNGYQFSDANGIQTLGTAEPLVLAPATGAYVQVNLAGTANNPALTLTDTTTGWFRDASGDWAWASSGTAELRLRSGGIDVGSTELIGWSSSGATTAVDTALCRNAAGLVEIGSGTSCASTGGLVLAGVISEGTKFTASGCTNSTTLGGATAGSYHSGTTGTCTVTITIGNSLTSPNGWACRANDLTTTTDSQTQTATTTTTATISGTTVTGDVVNFACTGY